MYVNPRVALQQSFDGHQVLHRETLILDHLTDNFTQFCTRVGS